MLLSIYLNGVLFVAGALFTLFVVMRYQPTKADIVPIIGLLLISWGSLVLYLCNVLFDWEW